MRAPTNKTEVTKNYIMNRNLNKYVNYLQDNNPSPFCDYIICKELLKLDEKTVKESYEWAKQFKLYQEIEREQLPDGSWGGFDTWHSNKYPKNKYKATARAIGRLLDLSLDGIDDPMVNKVIEVIKKYLTGELPDPEFYGKENSGKPIGIRQQMIQNLGYFEPENDFVADLRNKTAERFKKCCEDGYVNKETWDKLGSAGHFFGFALIDMLSYGNALSDDLQRMLLAYSWEKDDWGWTQPCKIRQPEDKWFIFWIRTVDRLKNFSLFGEFIKPEVEPYLYFICEKIINDENNQMQIAINNYFYHHGQYTDIRNTVQKKKNDLLLQIIRILNNIK